MFELKNDRLIAHCRDHHDEAQLTIEFQRTLRIPDDGRDYPLPAGLGRFPVRHVDDFAHRVPSTWLEHGGVMMPMYQAEALWIKFNSKWLVDRDVAYPFAVRIAAGKICAVSGDDWRPGLSRRPRQNYMVVPEQPWLDGFSIEEGVIRQFVAVPLGDGYTAEEQLTGAAEHGDLQITVHPMKRQAFERRFPVVEREAIRFATRRSPNGLCFSIATKEMGLAPGGRMRQQVYADPYDPGDWEEQPIARCFVHLANSQQWRHITGEAPPHQPVTPKQYRQAGIPWFDYYDEPPALPGSPRLARLKSLYTVAHERRDADLPPNDPAVPTEVITLRRNLKPAQVREGRF